MTFDLPSTFLDEIPAGWVGAGTSLGHAVGSAAVEWVCGNVTPLGSNRFRISLSRTWPDCPTYLVVRHPGDATYRPSVQPGQLVVSPNQGGTPQTIRFHAIPDQSLA